MTTKLTLSINEREEQKESAIDQINEIMSKYEGKIKLPSNVNYKEMIMQWRYEDYMKESEKRMNTTAKKRKM